MDLKLMRAVHTEQITLTAVPTEAAVKAHYKLFVGVNHWGEPEQYTYRMCVCMSIVHHSVKYPCVLIHWTSATHC